MRLDRKAKVWFQAQGRRIVAIFILLFSAKFSVTAYWNPRKPMMQSMHMPGHIAFVASVTDIKKLDKLIRHLESIRRDMVHKSKHHDGITVRNVRKNTRR